jgi:hypothetical protein
VLFRSEMIKKNKPLISQIDTNLFVKIRVIRGKK